MLARLIIIVLLCPVLSAGAAVRRFPTPDFETAYRLPQTLSPQTRADVYEYLDVTVLCAALALAAWLTLRKRSRRGLFVLMVFSLAYFGFWRKGCVCPIGAVQNMTAAFVDTHYAVPLTVVAFFVLPLVFALLFGRVFCAGVCPLGAVQDMVVFQPVKVPVAVAHALEILPHVFLGVAVLLVVNDSGFLICRLDPFVPFFRRTGTSAMFITGGVFLAAGMVIARPYCRFICPYGVLLNWASRLSRRHLTITPDECIKCRLCEDACPFGAILPATEEQTAKDPRLGRRAGSYALMLPVLVAVFALAGGWAGPALSHANRVVRLAGQIADEDRNEGVEVTDQSRAFRAGAISLAELHGEAERITSGFIRGGRVLGVYLGLVIGLKLVALAGQRRRETYEPDRGRCLSCGRCFEYCPREHLERRGGDRLTPSNGKSEYAETG